MKRFLTDVVLITGVALLGYEFQSAAVDFLLSILGGVMLLAALEVRDERKCE